MRSWFYDKTAKIERYASIKQNGSFVNTKEVVYESISCAFWKVKSNNYKDGQEARQVDSRNYTLNTRAEYNNILAGDKLTLTENSGVLVGEYKVLDKIEYPGINGRLDNISLTISIRENG